ncbi:hypothetical protein ABZX77_13100 [Streptomyces sp. NPDC004237]|uniref:hypothetical protein n=1 Tax=Streptomyces sp. NPDC004237 TaxID=3154455 RepID=UPI0033A104DB
MTTHPPLPTIRHLLHPAPDLGIRPGDGDGAEHWPQVFTELTNRGLDDSSTHS